MQLDRASNSSWEDECSAMPVAIGDVLGGKYRIIRVLGKGGMGVVMAAVHIELGHRVALKFLAKSGAQNEETLARFAREAKAAAMIQSEHATRILDLGRLVSGEPYMVLEMLEGCDLGALITRQGPLPIEQAVDYVLEACEAIAEAHSLGIVHRDLKPDNLFLVKRPDGTKIVKVLDFGISKFAPTVAGESDNAPALTTTSAIIGSPMYMSPEQLRATRDVDHRTDIWSLGVTLYELISGQIPFPWRSMVELSAAILKDPPAALSTLVRAASPELDNVIFRCLEKNRADRYQTVAELAAALVPFGGANAQACADRAAELLARMQTTKPAAETVSRLATSKKGRNGRKAHFSQATTRPADEMGTTENEPFLLQSRPTLRLPILPLVVLAIVTGLLGAAVMQISQWRRQSAQVTQARRGIADMVNRLPVISAMSTPAIQQPAIVPLQPMEPTVVTIPKPPPLRAKPISRGTSAPTNTPAARPNPFANRE